MTQGRKAHDIVKAASVRGKGQIEIEELPVPEPPAGMVLLKVLYCSICGSDVERLYSPVWDLATEEQLKGLRGAILGHEHVARVQKLGEGVTGLSVGDRVVDMHIPCGTCYYCIRGMGDLCMGGRVRGHPYDGTPPPVPGPSRWGAMAEYTVRPARRLLKVPDSISDEEAAMTEPLATGVTALHAAGTRIGDSAVIIGVGHIGLCVLAAARAAGAAPLIAIDKNRARLRVAADMGANIVLNPDDTDVIQAVVDATRAGPDFAFTCVSSQAAGVLEQAFEMVRFEGTVIIVGAPAPAALPTGKWLTKRVTVRGVVHMGEKMFPSLRLMEHRRVDVRPMITEVVPLEDTQRGFESLRDGQNIAVLLKP